MLGHTSITMTMRYVHPAAEQKRLAAAKLETFRVNGLMVAASEQAAEQERLAAAKLETFRINGLMEAASEQAVGTKMGTADSDKLMDHSAKYLKNLVGAPRFELGTSCAQGRSARCLAASAPDRQEPIATTHSICQ
jgi:hypothetical protein